MDRRTAFFTEFADLLQRHGVSLIVRETVESYQLVADGIDIDLVYRVEDHPQAGSKLGLYIGAVVDIKCIKFTIVIIGKSKL